MLALNQHLLNQFVLLLQNRIFRHRQSPKCSKLPPREYHCHISVHKNVFCTPFHWFTLIPVFIFLSVISGLAHVLNVTSWALLSLGFLVSVYIILSLLPPLAICFLCFLNGIFGYDAVAAPLVKWGTLVITPTSQSATFTHTFSFLLVYTQRRFSAHFCSSQEQSLIFFSFVIHVVFLYIVLGIYFSIPFLILCSSLSTLACGSSSHVLGTVV